MIVGSLARRYARALLDLGTSKGILEQIGKEMDELGATFSGSRDLAEALTNPVFARAKRRGVLEAVVNKAGVSPLTRNFTLLLFDHERIPYLPAIARELRLMVNAKAGRVRAVVTSARPLAPSHAVQVQSALERASGKTVILEKREDPGLIGGVVARIGDVVYDGSVRTQLELVRQGFLHE